MVIKSGPVSLFTLRFALWGRLGAPLANPSFLWNDSTNLDGMLPLDHANMGIYAQDLALWENKKPGPF